MKYIRHMLKVWIGRDSEFVLPLFEDGEGVQGVTRAVFSFGDFCVDSDQHATQISILEDVVDGINTTHVLLTLGHIDNLVTGEYIGYLTIYDAEAVNGIPWGDPVIIKVGNWPTC